MAVIRGKHVMEIEYSKIDSYDNVMKSYPKWADYLKDITIIGRFLPANFSDSMILDIIEDDWMFTLSFQLLFEGKSDLVKRDIERIHVIYYDLGKLTEYADPGTCFHSHILVKYKGD